MGETWKSLEVQAKEGRYDVLNIMGCSGVGLEDDSNTNTDYKGWSHEVSDRNKNSNRVWDRRHRIIFYIT